MLPWSTSSHLFHVLSSGCFCSFWYSVLSLYFLSSGKIFCCFLVLSFFFLSSTSNYEIVLSSSSLVQATDFPVSTSACIASTILQVWLWENTTLAFCQPVSLISPHSNSSFTVIIILKSHSGHPLAQRDGSVYKKMHADVAAWQMTIIQLQGGKTAVLQLLISSFYNRNQLLSQSCEMTAFPVISHVKFLFTRVTPWIDGHWCNWWRCEKKCFIFMCILLHLPVLQAVSLEAVVHWKGHILGGRMSGGHTWRTTSVKKQWWFSKPPEKRASKQVLD